MERERVKEEKSLKISVDVKHHIYLLCYSSLIHMYLSAMKHNAKNITTTTTTGAEGTT